MSGSVNPEPTMLFCLGANKAGTSWLYNYLAGHPDCRMPVVKELHYFDARLLKRFGPERRRITALRDERQKALARAAGADAEALEAELAELEDWRAVLGTGVTRGRADQAYRSFLLGLGTGGARLVGDITPAYALLPKRLYLLMQSLAAQVRFLYILRDPVDRLWSNIRMNAVRQVGETAELADEALRQFDVWAEGRETAVTKRSDYAGTLTRLAATIAPANLRVIFYENLFTPAAIARLCDFLGIAAHPARFAKRVHAGVPVTLDPARQARARAILAPHYDYVRRTMADLPPRWRENMGEM